MTFVMKISCDRSNSLLIGKLIGQGSSRAELVGEARTNGVKSDQIQEVRGREIAESARQQVEPEDELQIGELVREFEVDPDMTSPDFIRALVPIERKQGKILDEDVQIGRLVESPVKVLAEIKADGGSIEMVDGEIVAGDAGNLNVVSMRTSRFGKCKDRIGKQRCKRLKEKCGDKKVQKKCKKTCKKCKK